MKSHFATSNSWGGRRKLPYAFTEHGILMLSSVLRSNRAIQVNIEIMRTFVQLRKLTASHDELTRKITMLENKYDKRFKIIFDALKKLMIPQTKDEPKRQIRFRLK